MLGKVEIAEVGVDVCGGQRDASLQLSARLAFSIKKAISSSLVSRSA